MNKRRFQLSRSVKTKSMFVPYLEMQMQGLDERDPSGLPQVKGKPLVQLARIYWFEKVKKPQIQTPCRWLAPPACETSFINSTRCALSPFAVKLFSGPLIEEFMKDSCRREKRNGVN